MGSSEESARLYRLAAEQGHSEGQYYLAHHLLEGPADAATEQGERGQVRADSSFREARGSKLR